MLKCQATIALALVATWLNHADAAPLIAIDVGHSKANPGATSARGRPEFEFNAELANVVYGHLQTHNIPALAIGQEGTMLVLADRTAAANKAQASFLLSLHHDSVQPKYLKTWQWQGEPQQYSDQFSGFSLFISRKNPHTGISLHCASAIGAALQQRGFQASAHHHEALAGENKAWADQQHGVYFYDNLMVLKTATMPAVLLEADVIVNRSAELAVQQPSLRSRIAEAIMHGLQQCGQLPSTPHKTP